MFIRRHVKDSTDGVTARIGGSFPWASLLTNKDQRHTVWDNGQTWLLSAQLYDHLGSQIYICVLTPEDDVIGGVKRSTTQTIIVCVFVTLAGIIMVLSVVFVVSGMLKNLQDNMDSVARMDLTVTKAPMLVFSELKATNRSFQALRHALTCFGLYVPMSVVKGVLAGSIEARLGMRQDRAVVTFQDIESFTALCERYSSAPDKIITLVSPVFEEVSRIITDNHGTIDKYIGDCIMAFWEVGRGLNVGQSRVRPCRHRYARQSLGGACEP